MATKKINPSNLYDSTAFGFSHAAVQDGGRVLHLAGQVAWDAQCNVVGIGDFAAQVDQALANISAVLEHSGLGPSDVVRLRTYIVDNDMERLGAVVGALKRFYGGQTPAPNTVVGVQSLALPDFLVEIEAIAQFNDQAAVAA